MKRIPKIIALILIAFVLASAGDLAKPPVVRGNIINADEISNVYDLLKGDSTYSDISINGVSFSDSGLFHVDTLVVDSVDVRYLTADTLVTDSISVGNLTLSGLVNGLKVYRATITQSSTSAPVAVVFENTLGDTVDYTRTGLGAYVLATDSAFVEDKTFLYIGGTNGAIVSTAEGISLVWHNADSLYLSTADTVGTSLGDSLMTDTPIEILVYP